MSIRTSIMLIIALALVAGYVFFVQLRETPERKTEPPWFYNVDMDDISRIAISHKGEEAIFVLGADNHWHLDGPEGLPVGMDRWSGITLLLSGPKTRRLLESQPTDLEPYGLDSPPLRIQVDLKDGRSIPLLLGLPTPDGVGIYAQMEGFPQIYTVVSSWGDVLTRLISEPPYPPLYYDIDTSLVTEIELQTPEQTVTLTKDEEGWRFDDEAKTPVDEARLPSILSSLEQPAFQQIVEYRVRDGAPYGLDEPPLTLFLLTKELREDNITYTNEILMSFGKRTEDGKGYYVQNAPTEEDAGPQDVYQVDAAWVEALRAIVAQPPYPPPSAAAESGPDDTPVY